MSPNPISVVIPAHNEEAYIARCLRSVRTAEKQVQSRVEIVVVLNRCADRTEAIAKEHGALVIREDAKNLARIRNTGVKTSTGKVIVTIDADSWMSVNMLREITRHLNSGKFVGGGVRIMPERISVGIFFSLMTITPKLVRERSWAGLFWLTRDTYNRVGGFNEKLVSAEDIDFARRLKTFGKTKGLRYGMIWRAHIVTSCRKFDQFGDWYLFQNRKLVKRLLSGKDQEAADHFYYDAHR